MLTLASQTCLHLQLVFLTHTASISFLNYAFLSPQHSGKFKPTKFWSDSQNRPVCGALSALSCGQRTLLYLSLIHRLLWHMNCHCTGTDPPQRLQHIEHPVPHVMLWIIPLHNVDHASAVPGVTSHHVDVPVKHCNTDIALAPWHWRHRRPLVRLWAVVLAAQDVVIVAAAPEVIPAHDVKPVSDGAHAVQATELHHVGPLTPRVSDRIVTPKLLLEHVTCDST